MPLYTVPPREEMMISDDVIRQWVKSLYDIRDQNQGRMLILETYIQTIREQCLEMGNQLSVNDTLGQIDSDLHQRAMRTAGYLHSNLEGIKTYTPVSEGLQKSIADQLIICRDRYDGILLGESRFSYIVRDVTLRDDDDNWEVEFGDFKVTIELRPGGRIKSVVHATPETIIRDDLNSYHPHVYGNSKICFGDNREQLCNHCNTTDILEVMELCDHCLLSYNISSAYSQLPAYLGVPKCCSCNEYTNDVCSRCGRVYCANCLEGCDHCEDMVCHRCTMCSDSGNEVLCTDCHALEQRELEEEREEQRQLELEEAAENQRIETERAAEAMAALEAEQAAQLEAATAAELQHQAGTPATADPADIPVDTKIDVTIERYNTLEEQMVSEYNQAVADRDAIMAAPMGTLTPVTNIPAPPPTRNGRTPSDYDSRAQAETQRAIEVVRDKRAARARVRVAEERLEATLRMGEQLRMEQAQRRVEGEGE